MPNISRTYGRVTVESKQLLKMFEENINCDVTILAKDTKIRAHSLLLREASSVFGKLLKADSTEPQILPLDSPLCNKLLCDVIRYLYSGVIEVKGRDALVLLEFAHNYKLNELRANVEDFLKAELAEEDAVNVVATHGKFFSDETRTELEKRAAEQRRKWKAPIWPPSDYILNMKPATLISFLKSPTVSCDDELQVFKLVVEWWKRNATERIGDVTRVLKAVNEADLDLADVTDILKDINVLHSAQHPLSMFLNSLKSISLTELRKQRPRMECGQKLLMYLGLGL